MKSVLIILIFIVAGLCVWNCSRDTDVTSSPRFEFSSFAGTVWKTKVKLAIQKAERRVYLIPPMFFDKTHPRYTEVQGARLLTIVPIGSRVRIDRLLQDNGDWGGVRVTATVDDGAGTTSSVYVDEQLLAPNSFLGPRESKSKMWTVNPDMLEK